MFFLRQIVLNQKEKITVAVTSSAGMAALLPRLDATTLHHWSGLGDGKLPQEELNTTFHVDDNFAEARKRFAATDILAIDEIGIVSEVIFDKLEAVFRLVKGSNRVFGGLLGTF